MKFNSITLELLKVKLAYLLNGENILENEAVSQAKRTMENGIAHSLAFAKVLMVSVNFIFVG